MENLFIKHVLTLPLFLFLYQDIYKNYNIFNQSGKNLSFK